MKKLVFTLALGLFFVTFSNAQEVSVKKTKADKQVTVKASKAEFKADAKANKADKKTSLKTAAQLTKKVDVKATKKSKAVLTQDQRASLKK